MPAEPSSGPPLRTMQLTGLAYVTMAISAGISFLGIRPQLFVPGDAPASMSELIDNETLARLALVADLVLIASGAATALLFFALFRAVDAMAAGSLAAFGFLGSIPILMGTAFSAAALEIAVDGLDSNNNPAEIVLLLLQLKEAAWSVAALPFGLWLLPMGWLALRSGWIPRILGIALIVGGMGYIASSMLDQLRPEATTLVEALTVPATIAEFSMMTYLVVRGSFSKPPSTARSVDAAPTAPMQGLEKR